MFSGEDGSRRAFVRQHLEGGRECARMNMVYNSVGMVRPNAPKSRMGTLTNRITRVRHLVNREERGTFR